MHMYRIVCANGEVGALLGCSGPTYYPNMLGGFRWRPAEWGTRETLQPQTSRSRLGLW